MGQLEKSLMRRDIFIFGPLITADSARCFLVMVLTSFPPLPTFPFHPSAVPGSPPEQLVSSLQTRNEIEEQH